jgi:pimeloyl-ACP methyl ester carboxylesterase
MADAELDDLATEEGAPPIEVHRDVFSGIVRLRTTEWRGPLVDPSSTPIVALPGVLAPRISFRALATRLAETFRVIAVDFPGFGESEKPPSKKFNYGVGAFSEAIFDLFAGLGLSRAHLLGHGVGGAVALKMAARHPESVARLALIAPLVHPAGAGWGARTLLAPILGSVLLLQVIGKGSFARLYRERINPDISLKSLEEYYSSLSEPASRGALLQTLRSSQDTQSLIADSRIVRAPSLILWGRDDRLFPVEHGRFLSREMPSAGLELFSCAHAPHEQRPEETARALSIFYSGNRAGSL